MSPELLRNAIAASDVALLSKCPGIGKKTAERLVIELKDKVSIDKKSQSSANFAGQETVSSAGNFGDAVSSLIILGYKPVDADKLVRKAANQLGSEAATEALIKAALG